MLIQDRKQFEELKEALQRADKISADTETKKTHSWPERTIMGVAFSVRVGRGVKSWYFPIEHSTELLGTNQPREWLLELPWADPNKVWIFHNAPYDRWVLQQVGVEIPSDNVDDTVLLAYLVNENRFSFELDHLSKLELGKEKISMKKNEELYNGWDNIPMHLFAQYAEQDTALPLDLHDLYYPQVRDLWTVYRSLIAQGEALHRASATGLLIDLDVLREQYVAAADDLRALQVLLGFDPAKTKQLHRILLGPHEEGGLALPVLERDPKTLNPSFSESVLQRYELDYPEHSELINRIINYRKISKLRSTYMRKYLRTLGTDGRVHPEFKQHGTVTGRLSGDYQQIPREPVKSLVSDREYDVHPFFIAPEGYYLVEVDLSQIELRAACVYAQEEMMIQAYINGDDIHHMTAESINSYSYFPENPKEGRQVGKTTNFLLLYGGGADKLRATLWRDARMDIPLSQCAKWAGAFHETYPGFKRMLAHCKRTAYKRGYVKLWNGRLRRFPDKRKTKDAWNSVVQGGCSAFTLEAIVQISASDLRAQPVNTVHDSIWLEIPKDNYEEEVEEVKRIMTSIPEKILEIPVEAEARILA